VNEPARVVLDKLEASGFTLVGMSGIGQTCVWTMHNPAPYAAVADD
jgi:GTP cyclohydrolase I feedback regulatory protein (GFRP)